MSDVVVPTPERHGRLTHVRDLPLARGERYARADWRCDCGRVVPKRVDAVRNGGVKSCGCPPPKRSAFTAGVTRAMQAAGSRAGVLVARNNTERARLDAELMARMGGAK